MNLTPILFLDLAIVISVLILALGLACFYLFRLTRHSRSVVKMKDESVKENAALLNEARIKATRIIDDANSQALDIISKANLFSGASSEVFEKSLSDVSSAQIKEFDKASSNFTALYFRVLQDLKTKNIEMFQNISKNIESDTLKELDNFKDSMEKLTTSSQNEVKKKITTDYESLQKEIEDCKKKKLEEVESQIYEVLERIAKLALGKALSLSEHEALIEKSIEKAKEKGVFE